MAPLGLNWATKYFIVAQAQWPSGSDRPNRNDFSSFAQIGVSARVHVVCVSALNDYQTDKSL